MAMYFMRAQARDYGPLMEQLASGTLDGLQVARWREDVKPAVMRRDPLTGAEVVQRAATVELHVFLAPITMEIPGSWPAVRNPQDRCYSFDRRALLALETAQTAARDSEESERPS